MSKRTKATVDYFPHIIKKGKTIFILENKFGNNGYAFWFKLLELLGASEDHYIDCNDPSTWEYLLAYIRVDEETVNRIIEVLIELGILTGTCQHKIIFCQNFVDNVGDVYKRRIIEKPTKEAICKHLGIVLTVKCIHLPTSEGSTADICPQSKVKYSKVKESIYKERERPSASGFNKTKKETDPLEFDFRDKCWYGLEDWRIKMFSGKYPYLNINYLLEDVYRRKFLSDPLEHQKKIAIAGGVEELVWSWLGQDEKFRKRKELINKNKEEETSDN